VSPGSERPPRRRRQLTPDERALWKTVTRSVAPLRSVEPQEEAHADARPPPEAEAPGHARPVSARAKTPPRLAQPSQPPQPPLAPLGRRLRQRVARGSASLDGRIDLHGLTQEDAHHALRRFLRDAQADGAKLVLVITGKGARGASFGEERGVLKRLVPQWLRLPEFRATVVGFEPAHASHGGEGALYVRIRRRRQP
jgi:DNA-nicking Smr family endonuclease